MSRHTFDCPICYETDKMSNAIWCKSCNNPTACIDCKDNIHKCPLCRESFPETSESLNKKLDKFKCCFCNTYAPLNNICEGESLGEICPDHNCYVCYDCSTTCENCGEIFHKTINLFDPFIKWSQNDLLCEACIINQAESIISDKLETYFNELELLKKDLLYQSKFIMLPKSLATVLDQRMFNIAFHLRQC